MLVQRHVAGSEEAFARLAERYQDRLFRLAYRMLGNADDAQDAVQEVLLRLLKSLPRYRPEAKFSTWLYRLASNTYVDFLRKRSRDLRGVPLDAELQVNDRDADPDSQCERGFRAHVVDMALQELPESQRMLLVLRDREGLSNQEVAEILGVEVGTLKARLHRARGALRRVLESGVEVASASVTSRVYVSPTGELV